MRGNLSENIKSSLRTFNDDDDGWHNGPRNEIADRRNCFQNNSAGVRTANVTECRGLLRDFSFDVSVDGRRFRGSANGLEALAREREEKW